MNSTNSYTPSVPVVDMDGQSRGRFISRTYNHLFGSIVAFTLLEIVLFKSGVAESMAKVMLGLPWLAILGAFMVASWLARSVAHRAESKAMQYAALAGYVVAEAIIFVPLLYLADKIAPGAITSAAAVTLVAFAGLTLVAFWTRKDFSFLRGILFWAGIMAITLIVGGAIFHFQLGLFFCVAMVAVAGASILYDTSNVLHRYQEDRYVAAALELFASVALMMWYVLRIFMSRR